MTINGTSPDLRCIPIQTFMVVCRCGVMHKAELPMPEGHSGAWEQVCGRCKRKARMDARWDAEDKKHVVSAMDCGAALVLPAGAQGGVKDGSGGQSGK